MLRPLVTTRPHFARTSRTAVGGRWAHTWAGIKLADVAMRKPVVPHELHRFLHGEARVRDKVSRIEWLATPSARDKEGDDTEQRCDQGAISISDANATNPSNHFSFVLVLICRQAVPKKKVRN